MKYLDASAWVKIYSGEPGSDLVEELLDEGVCVASELSAVETIAAVSSKARAGDVKGPADEVLDRISSHVEHVLRLPVDDAVGELARSVARVHGLRGADAVHLATALLAQAALGDLTLVASDNDLLAAGRACGLPTLNPSEPE